MDEKVIKLTLAAQIAGQIINKVNFHTEDQDMIATAVADITKKIVDQLYVKF